MLKPLDAEASANGTDYTRILHTDLVLSVADHLAQPDLVALAGTSRRWRTITRTHQSFYYHVMFLLDPTCLDLDESVDVFCDALNYVRQQQMRASVCVDLWDDEPGDPLLVTLKPSVDAIASRVANEVERAIPFLVKLEIDYGSIAPRTLQCDIFPSWQKPAPHLRELCITAHLHALPLDSSACLPAQIFAGRAPLLERLTLERVRVTRLVPALTTARIVQLGALSPNMHLSTLFPHMRELTLGLVTPSQLTMLESVLSGLSRLTIGIKTIPNLSGKLQPLTRVPSTTINFHVESIEVPFAPFIKSLPVKPLRLDLLLAGRGDDVSVCVASLDGSPTRTFNLVPAPHSRTLVLVLHDLQGLHSHRVTEMHIHHHFFNGLTFIFRSIPELRTLRVSWPQNLQVEQVYFALMDPAIAGVKCPKLERLELVDPAGRGEISAYKLTLIQPGDGKVDVIFDGVTCNGTLEQVGDKFIATTSPEDDLKMQAADVYVSQEKMQSCSVQ